MGVVGSRVHLELGEELASHAVLGKHTAHSLFDDALGDATLKCAERLNLHGTRAAGGVTPVQLVLELVAAHLDLLGVDHHDVGPHVHGGGVSAHVTPAQVRRHQRREATQPKPRRVNHNPRLPAVIRVLPTGVVRGVEDILLLLLLFSFCVLCVGVGGWMVREGLVFATWLVMQ